MARRDWMKERDFCLGAAADFVMRYGSACDEIAARRQAQALALMQRIAWLLTSAGAPLRPEDLG